MARPAILYDSIFDRATLTATNLDTASGSDVDDIRIRKPHHRTKWFDAFDAVVTADLGLGNAEGVDTLAITGHNLANMSSPAITVAYSADGAAWTDAATLEEEPGENRTAFLNVDASGVTRRYWRVTVAASGPGFLVGAMALGRRLDFTEHFTRGFDSDAYGLVSRTSRARDGAMVGVVAKHATRRMVFKFVSAGLARTGFHDATGLPSKDHFLRTCWSNGRAFWFSWDGCPTGILEAIRSRAVFVPMAASSRAPIISSKRAGWSMELETLDEGRAA